jgi:predicted nucleotidyltransferase
MKTIKEIKKQLETLKPVLKEKYQVETLGIFGSYSRGEQKRKSDLDIIVEFSEPNDIDLFKFIELRLFLEDELNVKIDLVEKDTIKPRLKDQILQEIIPV